MSYHPNITQTFSTLAKQTMSKATSSSNSSKDQPKTATSSASSSNAANKTCYLVISPNANSGWYTSDMTVRSTNHTDSALVSSLRSNPAKPATTSKSATGISETLTSSRILPSSTHPLCTVPFTGGIPLLTTVQLQGKQHRSDGHDQQRPSGEISRTNALLR